MNAVSIRHSLGELCSVSSGGTPSRSKSDYYGGDIPWAKISDLETANGELSTTEETLTEEGLHAIRGRSFPKGTLLFAIYGSIGKMAFAGREVSCNQAILGIQNLSPKRLDMRYLFHWLNSRQQVFLAEGQGIAQKNLSAGYLRELQVPLPPLDEQRRIAAILDKADALRQKRRRAIALLDSLTQSIFLEMFGDPISNPHGMKIARLEDVARFYAGNSLPAGEPYVGQPDGHLMLKVSDMNAPGNEEVIKSSALWSSAPGSKAGTCPAGSIVFPKRGGAIATNKKRVSSRPAILDPNVMAVAANPAYIDADYLYQWFQGFNLADISSGSSVPQLNKQDLAPIEIVVPPLEMQQVFSERKSTLNDSKVATILSLSMAESLFASLQHRAFSDQL